MSDKLVTLGPIWVALLWPIVQSTKVSLMDRPPSSRKPSSPLPSESWSNSVARVVVALVEISLAVPLRMATRPYVPAMKPRRKWFKHQIRKRNDITNVFRINNAMVLRSSPDERGGPEKAFSPF